MSILIVVRSIFNRRKQRRRLEGMTLRLSSDAADSRRPHSLVPLPKEAIASARGNGSAWPDRSRALAPRAWVRELRWYWIGSWAFRARRDEGGGFRSHGRRLGRGDQLLRHCRLLRWRPERELGRALARGPRS